MQPAVKKIAEYIIDNDIAAYLLVPQCPTNREWIAGDDNPGCDDKVMELIQLCLSEKDIDANRIYIWAHQGE